MRKSKGKYVTIDLQNPSPLGQCDYSSFIFNHKDLCKQMEWRGNNFVWTGFMVGRPFLDKPNEYNRLPRIKADPYPVKNPRLPANYNDPLANPVLPAPQLLAKLQNFNWGA